MTTGATTNARGPVRITSAANPAAIATAAIMALTRYWRISRMMPQYSSDGIWFVFHRLPQIGHSHTSPYGTYWTCPQSHFTVMGAPRISRHLRSRLGVRSASGVAVAGVDDLDTSHGEMVVPIAQRPSVERCP